MMQMKKLKITNYVTCFYFMVDEHEYNAIEKLYSNSLGDYGLNI